MDKQYWKKAYQDSWKGGADRIKAIMSALTSRGINVETNSDDALSEKFIDETKHGKGEPDLKLTAPNGDVILLEGTGPDIDMNEDKPLWFRPDKFDYAETHPELEIWGAHILQKRNVIRFIKFEKGAKHKYETIHPVIRGKMETYKEIPADDKAIIDIDTFCQDILNRK